LISRLLHTLLMLSLRISCRSRSSEANFFSSNRLLRAIPSQAQTLPYDDFLTACNLAHLYSTACVYYISL